MKRLSEYLARLVILLLAASVVAMVLSSCSIPVNLTTKDRVIAEHKKFYRFKPKRRDVFTISISSFCGASIAKWFMTKPKK